ncbi:MAG TPA: DUF6443 domain-containing protein [Flavobacterium sp.]|uniref:DUF6443 domain-containing protein n=1 Tax=Flavobacterium sp. TaxID=239 RepID=UPI002DBB9D83|nr:DUF6443 domain-containing protein [Flavobacterium sp.]HEU4789549.1 DUF6443 domain-containing protein [Flavobacterium sp.]
MKRYITFFLLLPMLFFGQTQNYIKTTTYKQASLASISSPTPAQAQVDVTYFDGLGRPIEQIAKQQSNSGNDIITPIEYENGYQIKEYLPYASTQTTAAYIAPLTLVPNLIAQYKTNYGTVNDNPFSEKQLEASPLKRVLEQAAPGNDWSLINNHTIKLDYQTNAVSEVILYTATTNWSTSLGLFDISLANAAGTVFYNANALYKSITKNENWLTTQQYPLDNTTEEFKNKEGQVVLKRTYETGVKHDTYYVYDIYGNLTYVIPPKADVAITPAILNDLCYQYKYDYRNRLVEKKLPGKQWEFIVYDKLDRVVASGPVFSPFNDPLQAGVVGWMITKYDVFNRPIYTGWEQSTTVTSAGRAVKQTAVNGLTVLSESKTTTATSIDSLTGIAYYTNNIAPTTFKLLTVNYYDNYNFQAFTPAIAYTAPVAFNNSTLKPKGLPTGSWVRVLSTLASTTGESSYILYDAKARPVRSFSTNYLGGYTRTDSNFDAFSGQLLSTETRHKRLSGDAELYVKDAYIYTPQDRLLTHTHKIGTAGAEQLLYKNEYNELGQLIVKRVGGSDITGTNPLQKVDYSYNIRGWMTEINKTANLTQGTDPKDLFAFKINYNTVNTGITGVKALYNGNIAETYWNTADVQRAYGYKYDNLNRLTTAVFQKAAVTTNAYNETLAYDKNGNIMTLVRNGSSETATQIDNLVYSYLSTNSNQLVKVIDNAPAGSKVNGFADSTTSGDDYAYDINGNLIKDNNKNITVITYNHLNLPSKITFGTTGNIAYLYNAAGQKVQKIVTIASPSSVTTTDYLGGYQYLGGALQFFPTAEGYVESVTASSFKYVFQYKDHLGNVRLSYKDISATSTPSLQILEENNYFPFGLKHIGYGPAIVSTNQALKYKYNGKELQDDNIGGSQLNLYDYGARNYDPAIGRWMNIDPLAQKYVNISPYVYVANNVINAFDPDGKKIVFAKNATKEFKQAFKTAIKHLKANKADGIFAKLESRKETITIAEGVKGNDSYSSSSKTINWDPSKGLLTNEGVVISATTALNHEGDHALQSVVNPKQYSADLATPVVGYDNKEEQRVIEGSEQETAKALGEIKEGEVTRKDHGGVALIDTINPTSTTATNEVIITSEKKTENKEKQK